MKQYYPLGTIVTLRNGNKKLMICGRAQKKVDDSKIYDYCACLYPEGILNPQQLYIFDEELIEKIFFVGYQNEDEFRFKQLLSSELEKLKKIQPVE